MSWGTRLRRMFQDHPQASKNAIKLHSAMVVKLSKGSNTMFVSDGWLMEQAGILSLKQTRKALAELEGYLIWKRGLVKHPTKKGDGGMVDGWIYLEPVKIPLEGELPEAKEIPPANEPAELPEVEAQAKAVVAQHIEAADPLLQNEPLMEYIRLKAIRMASNDPEQMGKLDTEIAAHKRRYPGIDFKYDRLPGSQRSHLTSIIDRREFLTPPSNGR